MASNKGIMMQKKSFQIQLDRPMEKISWHM